jgi:molybdopterin-guanine dinucleotide biosynthesis protein A
MPSRGAGKAAATTFYRMAAPDTPVPNVSAILVLAGGFSRRLGTSKAWLSWHGKPLLLRVLDRLSPLAREGAYVAARPRQALPPGNYERVDDGLPGAGPLAALAVGLSRIAAIAPQARVAVSACDYPFTEPGLFTALAAAAPDADVVLPSWDGYRHPLQAVWRVALGVACEEALAAGVRRLEDLLETVDCAIVPATALAAVSDPGRVLLNMNDPGDLARALTR